MAKVRAPVVAYQVHPVTPRTPAKPQEQRAKLFASGRSQAVRLPKEFRMPGTEVRVTREGNRVVLEPIADPPCDANGWPIGFWDWIRMGDDEIDFPDPEPMPVAFLDLSEELE